MVRRNIVLDTGLRQQLVLARRSVGPPSLGIVKARTLALYRKSVAWFFEWCMALQITLPHTFWQLDELVSQAIDHLYNEGEPRGVAGNLLSGFAHLVPPLRGHLPGSWRLWQAWGRQELPCRAPALTWSMIRAMAYVCQAWGYMDVAVVLLGVFLAFLRTGELVGLRCSHILLNNTHSGMVFVQLPHTKTTSRSGGIESVSFDCLWVRGMLGRFLRTNEPGDYVLTRTANQFRKIFEACIGELNLNNSFRPYSLRRGGASHFFRVTGSMDRTMVRTTEVGGSQVGGSGFSSFGNQ